MCLNLTVLIHKSTILGSKFGISINDFIADIDSYNEDSKPSNKDAVRDDSSPNNISDFVFILPGYRNREKKTA